MMLTVTMTTLIRIMPAKHGSENPSLVSSRSDQTGPKPSLGFVFTAVRRTQNDLLAVDLVPIPTYPCWCSLVSGLAPVVLKFGVVVHPLFNSIDFRLCDL